MLNECEQRALAGIKSAGYRYVAWGTTHKDGARQEPVLGPDAAPDRAKELARKCRDLGLEPLMMFSGVYPEAPEAPAILKARVLQAAAGADPASEVRAAYELALTRPPTPEELRDALEFLDTEPGGAGLTALCRVLFNLNEFIYVD